MKSTNLVIVIFSLLVWFPNNRFKAEENNLKTNFIEIKEGDFSNFGLELKNGKLNMIFLGSDNVDLNNHNFDSKLKTMKILISDCKIETRNVKQTDISKCSKLIPNLIVVQAGNNSSVYYNDIKDFKNNFENSIVQDANKVSETNIDNWIAFHYKIQENNKRPFDIYLWYDKSKLMMEELSEKIKKEISKFQNDVHSNNPESDFTNSFIKNLKVFPNPAYNGLINISMDVKSERVVNLSIYDINGNLIIELIKGKSLIEGESTLQYNLQELIGGVYFVHLTTDKNEQISTRFILIKG